MALRSEDDQQKPIVRGKPFEKGKSGNPGGRPKENEEIKALALAECPNAFAELVAIYKDLTVAAKTRVAAIREIFDRGLGKAPQGVELTGAGGKDLEIAIYIGQKEVK